jgi:signal transduction histidine kinase
LLNILKNAVQAIEDKSFTNQQPTITITTESTDEDVFITISDNGIGMNTEVMNKIFEPFFTTKEVGRGTGLGLSIAYNIMEKHHGFIEVDSTPGEGSKFMLGIPKKLNEFSTVSVDKIETMKTERRHRLRSKANV